MTDAIDTFLSQLENELNKNGQPSVTDLVDDGDELQVHDDNDMVNNEFITASKLLMKRENDSDTNEDKCPDGPDIVDLFGDFVEEDESWLNDVNIGDEQQTKVQRVVEDEVPIKGFSLGSSVGVAKSNTKPKADPGTAQSGSQKQKKDGSVLTFGNIRIKDLLFEPHEIERRTKTATLITLSQIPWKVKTKNQEVDFDWVTFGVIVSKEMKSSTKNGSAYTLMKLSDLNDVSKYVSLFLFGESHAVHWKLSPSSVVGLLNPKIMANNQDHKKRGDEICSLTLNHPGHLVHVGTSVDLSYCKSIKKNGEICNAVINKKDCGTCIYHVQSEYKKMSSRRPELKLSYSGITPKSRNESSFHYSGDKDTELNTNHVALTGPMTAKSFNFAVKRALTDPSTDVSTKPSSTSLGFGSIDASSAAKKPRIGDPTIEGPSLTANGTVTINGDNLKKDQQKKKKKIKMTKEEFELEKKRRQDLIDSYQLRKKMEAEMIDEAIKAPYSLAARNLKAAIDGTSNEANSDQKKDIKAKIESAKGQRISLSGALNPVDIFKHLKPVEVKKAPIPQLGRGLKPGQDVTINLTKNRDHRPMVKKSNISIEDARKLRNNLIMAKKKAAAAKVLSTPKDPDDAKKKKLEELRNRVSKNFETESNEETKSSNLAKINEALNRKSKHVNEVKLIESRDESAYFSRLEKKEELEEKMAATTSIKVNGVVCPTCKYIAESQSEYCIKNDHKVLKKEVTKRFLACKSCNFRLVAYNSFIPNRSCPKCKGIEFKNSSLRPSKVIETLETLNIRGEECKFLNSIS